MRMKEKGGRTRRKTDGWIWICKQEIWHSGAKRFIRRRDGKPFRFRVYCKR